MTVDFTSWKGLGLNVTWVVLATDVEKPKNGFTIVGGRKALVGNAQSGWLLKNGRGMREKMGERKKNLAM